MSDTLKIAKIKFEIDIADIEQKIKDVEDKFDGLSTNFKKIGQSLTSFGSTLTKSLTLPIAGALGGLTALEGTFEECTKSIRVGTGAIGDDLEDLEQSFRNVAKRVPNALKDVSSALADINTRTGLTGTQLESLTEQFLMMSNITGEDVSSAIANVTRLFGDWGIEAEDMGDTLDYLFKVSQSTGIGVSELANQATTLGVKFRNAGWELEDALAILGRFEKEGVNTSVAFSGVNTALNNLASEGVSDISTAFQQLILDIQAMEDSQEAYNTVIDYFGAKAGPDMFDIIRSGRFDVEDLKSAIDGSNETIAQAASDAETTSEKIKKLKNEFALAVEPLTDLVVTLGEALMPVLKDVIEAVKKFTDWFSSLSDSQKETIAKTLLVVASLGPLLTILGKIITLIGTVAGFFGSGGILSTIGTAITGVLGAIATALGVSVGWVVAIVGVIIGAIWLLVKNWESVCDFCINLWQNLCNWFSSAWESFKNAWSNFWDAVFEFGKNFWNAYCNLCKEFWGGIANFFMNAWESFKNAWSNFWNSVFNFVSNIWTNISNFFSNTWSAISNLASNIWGGITSSITNFASLIYNGVTNAFTNLKNTVANIWNGMVTVIKTPINLIIGFINTLIKAMNAIHFKMPDWLGGKEFGFNIPTIPMLATGGEMREGTAIVGEAGAEMLSVSNGVARVTPLSSHQKAEGIQGIGGQSVVLSIQNFYNNRKEDIEELSQQLSSHFKNQEIVRGT